MGARDRRDLFNSVKDSYTDFLKDARFFSYMGDISYNDVIASGLPHGNCHILSKILQSRLQRVLSGSPLSIDIVGPTRGIADAFSVEYMYHTAVIVKDNQLDMYMLLDPGSFFVDPIVLTADTTISYDYLCLGTQRMTSVLYRPTDETITHQTQFSQRSLRASIDVRPLDELELQSFYRQHQASEQERYKGKQRVFVLDDRQGFVVGR